MSGGKQPSVQWLPTFCATNGAQTALMALTQILASQHMDYFSTLSESGLPARFF
jgi:RecG-like helicase